MTKLADKVALITGGSKGIGYGIAEALLAEGLKVVITGRTTETIDEAINRLNDSGEVLGITADVRSLDDMNKAVRQTIAHFGKLDVLIANAGIGHFASITSLTPKQWQDTVDINLTGVFNTVKASVDALKETKGYIITISSLAGSNFFASGTAYNASKFGLTGFTQALMLDLRDDDIKVSTIMPGSVSSHFGGRTPEDGKEWRIQPEDIGQITVDLLKIHPRTLPSKVEVRPSKTASI